MQGMRGGPLSAEPNKEQKPTNAEGACTKTRQICFPDDFSAFAKNLQARLMEKHSKELVEGRAPRALWEIRVQAAPVIDHKSVALTF